MRMRRFPENFHWQIARSICLFCAVAILGASIASAQHKSNRLRPRYLSNSPPDPERGREILAHFHSLGIAGDYYLQFDLEILPRRGKKSVVPGQMWGARGFSGTMFRTHIENVETHSTDRVVAHNGPNPRAWRYEPDGEETKVTEFDDDSIMDSIGGTGLTMFELQRPFEYWPNFVYEGTTEVRGRAVHAFLMYPPDSFAEKHPDVGGVRMHLDANFHALMQAVVLDAAAEPSRKFTVMDLKKLGNQWIPKSIDIRDEKTRDKVRFKVTAAALDLDFASQLFDPESLDVSIDPPSGVKRLGW